eukprot:218828_1
MADLELITTEATIDISVDTSDIEQPPSPIKKHSNEETNLFLYDINTKPTCIEKLFGEPYHVKDQYTSHQITIPFILTLMSVYAVEGCMDWLLIALRFYGASIHNIGPEAFSNFVNIIYWPWNVKIIYGLITDALPILGYKRKPYMLIFGILAPITMIIAITNSDNYHILLGFLTINSLCVCFCDVIADALNVERTQFKSHTVATRLQCVAWGSRTVAAVIGSLTTTSLVEKYGSSPHLWTYVFWAYAGISIPMGIVAIFVPEKRQNNRAVTEVNGNDMDEISTSVFGHNKSLSVKKILRLTYETLCRKSIFYPLLFVFILDCTPSTGEGIQYFLMYGIGFEPTKIGYLSVAAQLALLVSIGIITFQTRKSNSNFSLRKLFIIWTLIATFLPLLILILIFRLNVKWGISDVWFMISDTVVIGVASYMLFMGVNVMTARICPNGIEGIFMTVITSIQNIGGSISLFISAQLLNGFDIKCVEDSNDANNLQCDFNNLWIMVLVVNATSLIPLIWIRKIPNEEQLQTISEKLNKICENMDDKEEINRSEMIGCYWWMKKLKCCCCCK